MSVGIDKIIRSKRRTLTMTVEDDGSLIIHAPLGISEKAIREFVDSHTLWISKKQAQARERISLPARQFSPGEVFPYLGKSYELEIVEAQKKALQLDDHFKLSDRVLGDAQKAFQDWYRNQARQVICDHVDLFAARYDFKYGKIRISSARTRWGSCSPIGNLSFSWRLILNPIEVVDYVIIHELVHTIIHNHSKRFWRKVENILPDYREYNNWLRKNDRDML